MYKTFWCTIHDIVFFQPLVQITVQEESIEPLTNSEYQHLRNSFQPQASYIHLSHLLVVCNKAGERKIIVLLDTPWNFTNSCKSCVAAA